MLKRLALPTLCAFASFCQISLAENMQPSHLSFSPYFGAGMAFGGEKVLDNTDANGSSRSLNAGDGYFVELGGELNLSAMVMPDLYLRAAIGYQSEDTQASKGKAELKRHSFETTLYKGLSQNQGPNLHAIGLGLSHHRSIEYTCDITGQCDFREKFENATGPHIEYNYRFRASKDLALTASIRYTNIIYKSLSTVNEFDASHFDINLGVLTF